MVYLEKQYKNGKYFYYLTHTVRINSMNFRKIRHFIHASKKELDEADEELLKIEHIEEFESIIEKDKLYKDKTDYKHSIFFSDECEIFSKEDLKELEDIKREYKRLMKPENRAYYETIREEFIIRHSYDTNKVEGSTFSYEETKALLEKGLVLEPHKQREIYEITNIREAFDYIETYNLGMTNKFIKEVHKKITNKTLKYNELEGKYRTKGINVRMGNSDFKNVSGDYVERTMRELIKKFEMFYKRDKMGAIVRFYSAFIGIHPFLDGNGRTSRMLLNYLLMRKGLPPINFVEKEHLIHIRYIEESIKGESHASLGQFILNRLRLNHWTNR